MLCRRHNQRVAARFALQIIRYSPAKRIKTLAMPALLQVGLRDITTPAKPVIKASKGVSNVSLKTYNTDHFEPYKGNDFEAFVSDQLAFLKQLARD